MSSVHEIAKGRKPTLDDIYKYVVEEDFGRKTATTQTYKQKQNRQILEPQTDSLKDNIYHGYNTVKDSALGVGAGISQVLRSTLPQVIAPQLQTVGTALARFGGGLVTLAGTAPALITAYKQDKAIGDNRFYNTRREVAGSAGGIATAYGVGKLGALGVTALAAVGAPTAVLIGAGVLTVGAAGYGAYKVRQITENYFDKIN